MSFIERIFGTPNTESKIFSVENVLADANLLDENGYFSIRNSILSHDSIINQVKNEVKAEKKRNVAIKLFVGGVAVAYFGPKLLKAIGG